MSETAGDGSATGDVASERDDSEGTDGSSAPGGGATSWLLLEGDRLAVASVVVGGVLLVFLLVLWRYGYGSTRPSSPVYFLFSSLLTGDLTLITVVLSINQLVLSRELGAPGTLQNRIEGSVEYREDVEETVETAVSPTAPTEFLRFLHEQVGEQADRLDERVDDVDGGSRSRLRSLAYALRDDVRIVNGTLDRQGEEGVFAVVAATIRTNHAEQLHEIGSIRAGDSSPADDAIDETLDRLESYLLQIDVARNYFKTVYVQKELAFLSRLLLYVGVPAVVASGGALVIYNAATSLGVLDPLLAAVTGVAFTLGFAPLAILFAFVLRLAWVAEKTATVTPFASNSDHSQ